MREATAARSPEEERPAQVKRLHFPYVPRLGECRLQRYYCDQTYLGNSMTTAVLILAVNLLELCIQVAGLLRDGISRVMQGPGAETYDLRPSKLE